MSSTFKNAICFSWLLAAVVACHDSAPMQGFFAVLLDDGYLDEVDLHRFPTTWFIDRQGRIAFIKEAWSESLVEEFGWRVEALRGSDN